MYVEQIYTGCLAEAAYYIESNGEVAIIDPLRESGPYIELAEKRGAKIKYVMETHFHADFVSGHQDLAAKTGATIVFGPTSMDTGYDALIGEDNQEFKVGNATIRLIHTPGHTMESSCYLLLDEEGKEHGIFTGDTLFIGDVGRPDLAQKVIADMTQEKLASHMYDTVHNKILPMSDDIIVYPGHGAGSACGKNMSSETTDTLGNQKKTNYALNPDLSREEFIKQLLDGLTPPPGYFPHNVLMNIQGYDKFDEVLEQGTKALSPAAFEAAANETGALLLDARHEQTFAMGFIPNSINIGIDGSFAPWVGALIRDVKQEILLIADENRVEEIVTRMSRVGFDRTLGYLEGGFEAWKNDDREVDTIESVTVAELAELKDAGEEINILDVRRKSEHDSEHVIGAKNVPLDYINENMAMVDKDKNWFVHCAGGYRSMIFISILQSRGFRNLKDIAGGFKAIKENGSFEVSDYICPTTML